MLRFFSSPSAAARLDEARRAVRGLPRHGTALVVGATRASADELALLAARETGGLFGVWRVGYQELVTRLSLPSLAREGLSPTGGLSAEAAAARAAFEAV